MSQEMMPSLLRKFLMEQPCGDGRQAEFAPEQLRPLFGAQARKPLVLADTAKLNKPDESPNEVAPRNEVDIGSLRPWRIVLTIKHVPVKMIFDLGKPLVVGRFLATNGAPHGIDLTPFNAMERGVSRQHLLFQREGEQVVVIDNNSTNGTTLNGELLTPHQPYPVSHGDRLLLGNLEMQIDMLINPLDS